MKWKNVKGYDGFYQVSDTGEIKSIKRSRGFGSRLEDRIRRQKINKGYSTVGLSLKGKLRYFLVHRLVAEAFIENNKNFPQVNHKDGNKINNNVDNLEWCDHSYNQIHARKNKLQGGEKSNTAKLTERDVVAIRKLYPKVNSRELAEAFNIGQSTVCKIINNNYWKYVKTK